MWIEWTNGLINLDHVQRIYFDEDYVGLSMDGGTLHGMYCKTSSEAKIKFDEIKNLLVSHERKNQPNI